MVAPVVVNPEIDSKIASIKDSLVSCNNAKGRAPNALKTSQKRTVTMKPSLMRSSPFIFLDGNQRMKPMNIVIVKARKNIGNVFS